MKILKICKGDYIDLIEFFVRIETIPRLIFSYCTFSEY